MSPPRFSSESLQTASVLVSGNFVVTRFRTETNKNQTKGGKNEVLYGLELPGRDHEGLSRGWGGGDGGQ